MNRLRHQLRRKVKQSRHSLDVAQDYLKEVGSCYLKEVPELADKFILVHKAIGQIKEAVDKLLEEV